MEQLLSSNPVKETLKLFSNLTLLPDFFSKEECQVFINMINNSDPEQLKTRKRTQFDSDKLSQWVWHRLGPHYKYHHITDEFGNGWKACGLNSRFRISKYKSGDCFPKHEDGFYQPEHNVRTFTTFMVYLNNVPADDGGATNFTDYSFNIQPTEGLGCAFVVDNLIHSGEELKCGFKYLLRTDVMYYCDEFINEELYKEMFLLSKEADVAEEKGDIDHSIILWTKYQNISNELKNNLIYNDYKKQLDNIEKY